MPLLRSIVECRDALWHVRAVHLSIVHLSIHQSHSNVGCVCVCGGILKNWCMVKYGQAIPCLSLTFYLTVLNSTWGPYFTSTIHFGYTYYTHTLRGWIEFFSFRMHLPTTLKAIKLLKNLCQTKITRLSWKDGIFHGKNCAFKKRQNTHTKDGKEGIPQVIALTLIPSAMPHGRRQKSVGWRQSGQI